MRIELPVNEGKVDLSRLSNILGTKTLIIKEKDFYYLFPGKIPNKLEEKLDSKKNSSSKMNTVIDTEEFKVNELINTSKVVIEGGEGWLTMKPLSEEE